MDGVGVVVGLAGVVESVGETGLDLVVFRGRRVGVEGEWWVDGGRSLRLCTAMVGRWLFQNLSRIETWLLLLLEMVSRPPQKVLQRLMQCAHIQFLPRYPLLFLTTIAQWQHDPNEPRKSGQ